MLCGVGMLRASVNLELFEHATTQGAFGQHAFDSSEEDALGVLGALFAGSDTALAAGEAGVVPVGFDVFFGTGEDDFFGIDDDNEVTGVEVWRVVRLIFATQRVSNLAGEAAENLVVGVSDVPSALDGAGGSALRLDVHDKYPLQDDPRRETSRCAIAARAEERFSQNKEWVSSRKIPSAIFVDWNKQFPQVVNADGSAFCEPKATQKSDAGSLIAKTASPVKTASQLETV